MDTKVFQIQLIVKTQFVFFKHLAAFDPQSHPHREIMSQEGGERMGLEGCIECYCSRDRADTDGYCPISERHSTQ